jgi:hypothetical protein
MALRTREPSAWPAKAVGGHEALLIKHFETGTTTSKSGPILAFRLSLALLALVPEMGPSNFCD